MAFEFGFYDSVNGDRRYNSNQMSDYFSGLFSRGVCRGFLESLTVTNSGAMTVQVNTGKAFFSDGHFCKVTAAETLSVSAAESSQARIDRVVIRSDKSSAVRGCSIYVKQGTPALSPVAPQLDSSSDVEELSLAQLYIGAGAASVQITDERSIQSLCGWAYAAGSDNAASPSYETVTTFLSSLIASGSITILQTYGWRQIFGTITLNEGSADWEPVMTIPVPVHGINLFQTIPQWGSSYKRPMRLNIARNGQLRFRYGMQGQYEFMLPWYPVDEEVSG